MHIIQCDDKVQSDVVIHNQEEMERYMEQFEIHGFGGTDFRPVFGYVNKLIAKKAFRRLRGLIYFTDGYGTFPAKKAVVMNCVRIFKKRITVMWTCRRGR